MSEIRIEFGPGKRVRQGAGRKSCTLEAMASAAISNTGASLRSQPAHTGRLSDAVLSPAAPEGADAVDRGASGVCIRMCGRTAARVLSETASALLATDTMPVGHSAATLIGHMAVQLTRVEENAFELLVPQGSAESLWDDLARMTLEFG